MKHVFLFLVLSTSGFKLLSSNLPYLFTGNTNHLYNLNPAFHGEKAAYKNAFIEFGNQTMYGRNFNGASREYPVFAAYYHSGCFLFDISGMRQHATINNTFFSSASRINRTLRIGYGGSVAIENMDKWANGIHVNFGIALHKVTKTHAFSIGLNFKQDHYNARVQFSEHDPVLINFQAGNADAGIAYTNTPRRLKAGFSVFNLKKRFEAHIKHESYFSTEYFLMNYDRLGIFNLNKQFKLHKKFNLDNSVLCLISHHNTIGFEHIMLKSELIYSAKSERQMGLGFILRPLPQNGGSIMMGPSLSFVSGILTAQYSYQRYTNQMNLVYGGLQELGLKVNLTIHGSKKPLNPFQ